jgi:hypothetical protein
MGQRRRGGNGEKGFNGKGLGFSGGRMGHRGLGYGLFFERLGYGLWRDRAGFDDISGSRSRFRIILGHFPTMQAAVVGLRRLR